MSLAQLDQRVSAFATRKYIASLPRGYGITDVDWIGWTPERAHLPPNPQLAARIPGFRPAFASDDFLGVLSWLFTVVRNTCRRMLRPFARERRALGERIEEVNEIPSEALDPLAALQRWRMVHAVHEAIATLDRPLRDVLVLRDLEGLSGAEVCTALGLTLATMTTRLQRARRAARRDRAVEDRLAGRRVEVIVVQRPLRPRATNSYRR